MLLTPVAYVKPTWERVWEHTFPSALTLSPSSSSSLSFACFSRLAFGAAQPSLPSSFISIATAHTRPFFGLPCGRSCQSSRSPARSLQMALAVTTAAAGAALASSRLSLSAATSSSSSHGVASSASAVFGSVSVKSRSGVVMCRRSSCRRDVMVSARAVAMQDEMMGMDEDSEGFGELGLGQREIRQYPPGLQRYETMAVLRPDLTEDQRLALTQRYEEAVIAGGGLDVEMFNRGMQPLAYNIKTKNMGGVSNRYLDGIYLLFTYVTKPEAQLSLQKRLNADDDIIRSTTFRLKA